jgi:small-conductance mechanosensitive channel
VDIAPMVAGAGVVGIAVGFGAQTLVKDIVSGVFFLFDDAFRVGEYIQSGSYKGTVESFSLRSVRCATTAARSTPCRSASSARCRT